MTEPAPRLLYRPGDPVPATPRELAAWAADLRLDELAPALGPGEEGRRHLAWLLAPLPDADAVAYRQEVFRDLESPPIAAALREFRHALHDVRATLARAKRMRHPAERDRWLLDAMDRHDAATEALRHALADSGVRSRGLAAVRGHLERVIASPTFAARRAATAEALAALAGVSFRLRIGEHRVVVSAVRDEPDLAEEIRDTFARLRDGDPAPLRVDVFSTLDMNPLEAQVLERVVRLAPAPFELLAATVDAHRDVPDGSLEAIAADAGWFLAVLDVLAPLRAAGQPISYPVIADDGRLEVAGLVELQVARSLADGARVAAGSDLRLAARERLAVVTGPSQGGRTSFARAIGQLHVLAAAGCPVLAESALVPLATSVETVFDQAERLDDPGGRLRTELRHIRAMLERAGPETVVIANEPFASTTAPDALALARRLLSRLAGRGARVIAVTFLEELADDARAVSVAAVPNPDDPTARTYRFERRGADGLAHAQVLASRYRLGASDIAARVRR